LTGIFGDTNLEPGLNRFNPGCQAALKSKIISFEAAARRIPDGAEVSICSPSA